MKELYIVGAGSVGGFVASNWNEFDLAASYTLKGFVDDDDEKIGKQFCGYDVLGKVSSLLEKEEIAIVFGISFPGIKSKIIASFTNTGKPYSFPSVISPKSWISAHVSLGKGIIIYPGNCINYNSRVDDFAVLNMNCSVGHDCTIGKFTSLAPGVQLAGHTHIAEKVQMGIGASTIQNCKIASEAIIGGNAFVSKDIPSGVVAKGVPAFW